MIQLILCYLLKCHAIMCDNIIRVESVWYKLAMLLLNYQYRIKIRINVQSKNRQKVSLVYRTKV